MSSSSPLLGADSPQIRPQELGVEARNSPRALDPSFKEMVQSAEKCHKCLGGFIHKQAVIFFPPNHYFHRSCSESLKNREICQTCKTELPEESKSVWYDNPECTYPKEDIDLENRRMLRSMESTLCRVNESVLHLKQMNQLLKGAFLCTMGSLLFTGLIYSKLFSIIDVRSI